MKNNNPQEITPQPVTRGTLRLVRREGYWQVQIADYSKQDKCFQFWELFRDRDYTIALEEFYRLTTLKPKY